MEHKQTSDQAGVCGNCRGWGKVCCGNTDQGACRGDCAVRCNDCTSSDFDLGKKRGMDVAYRMADNLIAQKRGSRYNIALQDFKSSISKELKRLGL